MQPERRLNLIQTSTQLLKLQAAQLKIDESYTISHSPFIKSHSSLSLSLSIHLSHGDTSARKDCQAIGRMCFLDTFLAPLKCRSDLNEKLKNAATANTFKFVSLKYLIRSPSYCLSNTHHLYIQVYSPASARLDTLFPACSSVLRVFTLIVCKSKLLLIESFQCLTRVKCHRIHFFLEEQEYHAYMMQNGALSLSA